LLKRRSYDGEGGGASMQLLCVLSWSSDDSLKEDGRQKQKKAMTSPGALPGMH
jgi:hypothetical protein